MSAAPDSFAAHEAFAEVVRLYVKAGHSHDRANEFARKVLEDFVAGYGLALGPLSPPAAAPLALSASEAQHVLAQEMGGRTPGEVTEALESRGLRLTRVGVEDSQSRAEAEYVGVSEDGPVVDSGPDVRVKLTSSMGNAYEMVTVSEASRAMKGAGLPRSDAHRVVGELNSKGFLLVRKEG